MPVQGTLFGGSLDTTANNFANVDNQDVTNTQNEASAQKLENAGDTREYRNLISQLRDYSGKLLVKVGYQRTCLCGRKVVDRNQGVNLKIQKTKSGKRAHVSGLQTCGSVWHCPVCAYKISKQRRKEVINTIDNVYKAMGRAGFLTLTIPHYSFERCEGVLKALQETWSRMKVGRKWRDLLSEYRYLGYITKLEVTYGQNGWHPHLHMVLFAEDTEERLEEFSYKIFDLWAESAERKTGKKCSIDAFNYQPITNIEGAADYTAKWDLAKEMTDTSAKQGRSKGGMTPFQILREGFERTNSTEKRYFENLFREYAKTFHGRRHLNWSKGLKDLFCTVAGKNKADQDLVKDSQGEILTRFSYRVWLLIDQLFLKNPLLEIAETSERPVQEILALLWSHGIDCDNKYNSITLLDDS